MEGNRKSSNIQLGAFVAAGTLILLLALFYMGQGRNMFGNTIPVSVLLKNVQGLQEGNNVQFMGITVGTVKKIVLLSPTTIRVDMAIERESSSFITKDATAGIGTEGLMGNKIVTIKAGTLGTTPVRAGDILLPEKGIAVDSILQTLQITSIHAQTLARNLAGITGKIQKGNGVVGSLLNDSIMAIKLTQTVEHLNATSEKSHVLMNQLSQLVSNANHGEGLVGMLLSDTSVSNELKEAIHQIKLTSEQSAGLSAELLNVSKEVNSGQGIAHRVLKDTNFVKSVEESLLEIRQGSEKFNQNMEALQHNFLLKRFFRKKAQKQAEDSSKVQHKEIVTFDAEK